MSDPFRHDGKRGNLMCVRCVYVCVVYANEFPRTYDTSHVDKGGLISPTFFFLDSSSRANKKMTSKNCTILGGIITTNRLADDCYIV